MRFSGPALLILAFSLSSPATAQETTAPTVKPTLAPQVVETGRPTLDIVGIEISRSGDAEIDLGPDRDLPVPLVPIVAE
jgi:hypothetical protein